MPVSTAPSQRATVCTRPVPPYPALPGLERFLVPRYGPFGYDRVDDGSHQGNAGRIGGNVASEVTLACQPFFRGDTSQATMPRDASSPCNDSSDPAGSGLVRGGTRAHSRSVQGTGRPVWDSPDVDRCPGQTRHRVYRYHEQPRPSHCTLSSGTPAQQV